VTAGADITDATATAVAITTSGTASDIDLSVAAAKTLTIAGDKGLTLSSLTAAALTSITSTSTGAVTITPALATGITYTGFSGADTIEVGATTKAITTGAGDDVVTVSVSALGTGGSIAAGDGTGDVLSMTSSNAATASASTTFAGTISGFEKLKLAAVAASTTDTIDLANLDNINYVQSAGTTAGTPSTPAGKEVTTVTVSGVASHADTVTFDGKIVQLANGDTATQAAAKIAATSFTNYTVTASGAVLTVTNKVGGLATDLAAGDFVFTDALSTGKPTVAVATTVQGVTAVAPVVDTSEVQNMLVAGTSTGPVTFLGAAVAGTVGGQAAAAVIGAILSDSANVIATWNAANPSRELLSIAAGAGVDDLDLTFKITEGNVAPMAGAVSNGISFGNATTTTEGSLAAPAVVAVAEQFTASFAGVATGADEIVFDGVTITLADNDTSAQIAAKVALGAFPNWNATVSGSVVTFTSDPAEARTDVTATNFTINDIAAAAGTQSVVVAVATQGTAAVTGTAGVLELTNMASGGTLEINAAGGYGVAVKDASSGTADVLNLKLSSDGVLAAGTVTVANVETVNINGIDSDSTAHVDSLTLVATSAKTITVTGNAGLTLTNTGNTKVTSFDASSVTAGAVTFTSANTTATDSVSIKGGAGADVLVGNAGSDTIIGGAGADSLNGAGGVNTLTGGDGKDTFIFTTVAESAVKASTVTDLKAGDMIALNIGTALVDADLKLGAAVTGLDVTTAVFQDWVDASVSTVVAGGISWFQYLGNTYIVQDLGGNSSTFTNGEDNIIKITGNVDLTASTVVLGTGIVTIV
jgi:S-layer protein